ncbi:TNT domain-containing protein [Streptomyces sp. ISL-98]|uniref:TNT domain-containing protein n=1 Tax=Streptomyces sp. ISL-98 TaxID=2819192 RepID=UPI001BE7AC2F|nr:TNT domain-containing protein [Streptomyces sp. ISL-98]MBT2505473.1 TNT domain-containing protein [Streptomyces sp. ISL-98]
MNRMRTVLAALGAVAVIATGPVASAAPLAVADEARKLRPAPCTGQFQGDARLGPERLPRKWEKPVGPLVKGYQRTGALSPDAFLKKYWEGPADSGGWKYPPNDGFDQVNGEVDKHREELEEGQELDRFGSEFGSYLAPAGDPYAKRALPPQNLNTRDAAFPCDYHLYRVTKPFTVWQGSIAPWFEQPGRGQQVKLDPAFLDPGQGQRLSVKWLLDHGYLAPVVTK